MNEIKLILGDCIAELNKVKDGSVDMVLDDLPFDTTSNEWESRIPLDELWKHFRRIVKPHGAIVLFAVQPFTSLLIASNPKGYRHKWVWNKRQAGNFAVAKYMPLTIDEDILVFSANGERVNYYPVMRKGAMRTKGGKASCKNGRGFGGLENISYESDEYYPTSILEFASVPRTQRLHSAQKPIDLLSYLIKTYSVEGDTVLDCTFGSGSTIVAALEQKRKVIGIERDPEYFNIAVKRCAITEPSQLTGHESDYSDSPLFAAS